MEIFKSEVVKYSCSCKTLKPLNSLYFCRHCLELRCGYCVSHELDSHYCPNCLENMPSAEACLKKNRCANCWDCPVCQNTLSTRASTVMPSEEKTAPRKVYYLACSFCRWTSRDSKMSDQNVASGGWPEYESEHGERISNLLDYYRAVAHRDKAERETTKRFSPRNRAYMLYSEKFGTSSAALIHRKKLGLSLTPGQGDDGQSQLMPSVPTEEIENLSLDIFTKPVLLEHSTLSKQRVTQPEVQEEETSLLRPWHKHLMIKRSQRCRKCEHNLCKPEYNPTSIKFKIQLNAYYHIPEIRVVSFKSLPEHKVLLVIQVTNPCTFPTSIKLHPIEPENENPAIKPTGTIKLPQADISLPARDDAAEFDETNDNSVFNDDVKIVVWRRCHRVHIALEAEPSKNSKTILGIMFTFEHASPSTTTAGLKTNISMPVYFTVDNP